MESFAHSCDPRIGAADCRQAVAPLDHIVCISDCFAEDGVTAENELHVDHAVHGDQVHSVEASQLGGLCYSSCTVAHREDIHY